MYTVGRESKMVPFLWDTVWRFLRKLNIEVPYDLEILLLGIYKRTESRGSNRHLWASVHSNIIHNSPKVKTTCIH